MTEKKDNTGLIVIIIVILLAIIGVVMYMLFTKDTSESTDIQSEITTTEEDKITMTDVAGAYTSSLDDETEETTDETEEITDEVEETIDETEDTTEEDYVLELVLDEDGSAKLVDTSESDDTISGTYTINDKKITVTLDTEEDITTDTYKFTVNSDDSLLYDDQAITLAKTDVESLKYIK